MRAATIGVGGAPTPLEATLLAAVGGLKADAMEATEGALEEAEEGALEEAAEGALVEVAEGALEEASEGAAEAALGAG